MIDSARASHGGALVLRGEAGVGKTALLRYAAERAEGMRVLRAVGVEWEADLPFSALHQVVREGLGRLDRLPPPQAAAMRGAFGLSQERVEDRFLICLGALGLLADLAEEQPLLVAGGGRPVARPRLGRGARLRRPAAGRRAGGDAAGGARGRGRPPRGGRACPSSRSEGLDRSAARALLDGEELDHGARTSRSASWR